MASYAVRGFVHASSCGGSALDSGQSGYALALTQSDTPIQVLPPTNNGHAPTCPEERSLYGFFVSTGLGNVLFKTRLAQAINDVIDRGPVVVQPLEIAFDGGQVQV